MGTVLADNDLFQIKRFWGGDKRGVCFSLLFKNFPLDDPAYGQHASTYVELAREEFETLRETIKEVHRKERVGISS